MPPFSACEFPVLVAVAAAHLGHRADAADCGDAVADGATVPVECRAKAVLGGFHLREILQSEPEQLLLRRL